jgi:hypothetical protein
MNEGPSSSGDGHVIPVRYEPVKMGNRVILFETGKTFEVLAPPRDPGTGASLRSEPISLSGSRRKLLPVSTLSGA